MRVAVAHAVAVALAVAGFGCSSTPAPPPPRQTVTASPAVPRPFVIDCGKQHAPRPERDPVPMCWVPAGTMTMGTPVEADQPEDGPARSVTISRGFYLDQYEVTVAQFGAFVRAVGNQCPAAPEGTCERFWQNSVDLTRRGALATLPSLAPFPVTNTSHAAAAAYCEWVGKELPTEAEWELAARRDPAAANPRTYPWGNTVEPGIAACHVLDCGDRPDVTTRPGTMHRDVSAVGVHDLGGNVFEWTRDCYTRETACVSPCVDPVNEECLPRCRSGVADKTCKFVSRGGSDVTRFEDLDSKNRIEDFGDGGAGIRCLYSR